MHVDGHSTDGEGFGDVVKRRGLAIVVLARTDGERSAAIACSTVARSKVIGKSHMKRQYFRRRRHDRASRAQSALNFAQRVTTG